MSTAANGYDGTGAGGKLRRKPVRNSQSTPYDRPPIAFRNPSGSGNGWVSKIIEPASKIITAGAHMLFASLFRKRLLPPPTRQRTPTPPRPASDVDETSNLDLRDVIPENVGDQDGTVHHAKEPDSLGNNCANQGFYELEKMLEHKTFTKSEIDRLTALLNSQTVEAPAESNMKSPEARVSLIADKSGNLEAPRLTPVLDNGNNSEKYVGARLSPMTNTKVFEDHIATPAELAKAYMGSRSSKVSPSMLASRGLATRNDVPLINYTMLPSQSPPMNTEPQPSSQLIKPEMTPRSRGRSAIYSMARTPYSRMQKSSDFRSGNNYPLHSSQLALDPTKLSSSRQPASKRRSSVLDDDIGSVGPVRKIRQKHTLLTSQRLDGPVIRGGQPNKRSKDAGNGSSDAITMSIPSQSSEVAQKILQQLDKLSPSKEKFSECKPIRPVGKVPFTLTPDMLTGKALRSLEDIDSSKFMATSQENSLNDSVQRVSAIVDYNTTTDKSQAEENGSTKIITNSETAFYGSDRPHARNKRAFQMSAHEDYLDLDGNNGHSNDTSFSLAENPLNIRSSPEKNKTQMANAVAARENSKSIKQKTNNNIDLSKKKSELYQAASSGPVIPEKKDLSSYSTGTPTVTIQPTVNDNASSSIFGKVSSGVQSPSIAPFGYGANTPGTFTPIRSSFAPLANHHLAVQTVQSESKTSNLSVLSDPVVAKPDDKGAQVSGDREGNPSTVSSYGISTTSTFFSSGSYAINGLSNGSLSSQPAAASTSATLSSLKKVSDDGACNLSSSASTAFATSVPNTEAVITSVGQSSTSSTPFAAPVFSYGTSFKDTQVYSNGNGLLSFSEEKLKLVNAVSNISSNPFGGSGLASGMSNSTGFGSSTSSTSTMVGYQGLSSISNTSKDSLSQAPTAGTAAENESKNTPFQFGSSGVLSTPSGVSGTAAFASASASFSVSALTANVFGSDTTNGMNSLPSTKEASTVGSTSGSATTNLIGYGWQSSSSSIISSTTSSSTAPLSFFTAASSSSIPTSSIPGSLFGSTGASTGSTLSFMSASANTAPSPFSAQPLFGSPNSAFAFGATTSLASNGGNNNQMSMDDSMAEDMVHASAPSIPLFGQQQSNTGFVFGSTPPPVTQPATGLFQFGSQPSPAPSVTQPATGLFQFGSQPSPAPPVNQSPLQAAGSFNAGSSFSLGSGGGDKAGRKIIKVKKGLRKR